VLLSLNKEDDIDKEKKEHTDFFFFLGSWYEITIYSNNITWNFYENSSVEFVYYPGINPSYYMGKFGLTQNTLEIDAMPFKSMKYTYEFSNNNTKIILTSLYGGDQTILNKVK